MGKLFIDQGPDGGEGQIRMCSQTYDIYFPPISIIHASPYLLSAENWVWFPILKNLLWLHLGNGFNRYHHPLFKCRLWCTSLLVWVITGVFGFYWKCSESKETRTWTANIDDSGSLTLSNCFIWFFFGLSFFFFFKRWSREGRLPLAIFLSNETLSKPLRNSFIDFAHWLSKSYLWTVA